MKRVKRVAVACDNCGAILRRRPKHIVQCKHQFCDTACKNEWQKTNYLGSLNPSYGPNPNLQGEKSPHYGVPWTDERKAAAGEVSRKRFENPRMRWLAGTANRGKKFSPERIAKMHKDRAPESYSHPHSEETKKIIGEKSAAKWTPEYRIRWRKLMEECGYWVAESDRTDKTVYFQESNWCARMFDKVSEEDTQRLEILGTWNVYTNQGGLVRDHKYSRKSGFAHRVFPELLRHPVNCQLLTHGENVSKAQSKTRSDDDIVLNDLLEMIVSYDYDWREQKRCIELVADYRAGKRWKREETT